MKRTILFTGLWLSLAALGACSTNSSGRSVSGAGRAAADDERVDGRGQHGVSPESRDGWRA